MTKFSSDIVLRQGAALLALVPAVAALSNPHSVSARMVGFEGLFSFAILVGLVVVSAAITLDVFVNSIFSCGTCQLQILSKIREQVYWTGAFLLVVPLYSVGGVRHDYVSESSLFVYLVTCGLFVALAALDWNAKRVEVGSRAAPNL